MIFRRSPDGRFIARESALWHWLPTLLGYAWGNAPADLAEIAAKWCQDEACTRIEWSLSSLKETDPSECAVLNTNSGHAWFKRRDILIRAAKELRQL